MASVLKQMKGVAANGGATRQGVAACHLPHDDALHLTAGVLPHGEAQDVPVQLVGVEIGLRLKTASLLGPSPPATWRMC